MQPGLDFLKFTGLWQTDPICLGTSGTLSRCSSELASSTTENFLFLKEEIFLELFFRGLKAALLCLQGYISLESVATWSSLLNRAFLVPFV
jgi:hypothetical protein